MPKSQQSTDVFGQIPTQTKPGKPRQPRGGAATNPPAQDVKVTPGVIKAGLVQTKETRERMLTEHRLDRGLAPETVLHHAAINQLIKWRVEPLSTKDLQERSLVRGFDREADKDIIGHSYAVYKYSKKYNKLIIGGFYNKFSVERGGASDFVHGFRQLTRTVSLEDSKPIKSEAGGFTKDLKDFHAQTTTYHLFAQASHAQNSAHSKVSKAGPACVLVKQKNHANRNPQASGTEKSEWIPVLKELPREAAKYNNKVRTLMEDFFTFSTGDLDIQNTCAPDAPSKSANWSVLPSWSRQTTTEEESEFRTAKVFNFHGKPTELTELTELLDKESNEDHNYMLFLL